MTGKCFKKLRVLFVLVLIFSAMMILNVSVFAGEKYNVKITATEDNVEFTVIDEDNNENVVINNEILLEKGKYFVKAKKDGYVTKIEDFEVLDNDVDISLILFEAVMTDLDVNVLTSDADVEMYYIYDEYKSEKIKGNNGKYQLYLSTKNNAYQSKAAYELIVTKEGYLPFVRVFDADFVDNRTSIDFNVNLKPVFNDFALNDSKSVVANYDTSNHVLTISGNGQIDYDKWEEMARKFEEDTSDLWNMWDKKQNYDFKIKFEASGGKILLCDTGFNGGIFQNFRGGIEFNQSVDTSGVTNMESMFERGGKILDNINDWDVSSVTNMESMFEGCKSFNSDISDWDVSSVKNMYFMFLGCESFNQDIGNWDVSSVTDMYRMFGGCTSFNQDIGDWDVSNVTRMGTMFADCTSFNQDIGDWDVSNVTGMRLMFARCKSFNGDIGDWDVSNVKDMDDMFQGASAFNQDIGNWNISNATGINSMLSGCESFNQDISGWDISKVTNMEGMFEGCKSFNQDIGDWDVSKVTNMERMFEGCESFNQDIGDWDVSKVTNMERMFEGCESFNQDIGDWDVSKVTNMERMFEGCESFNQDIGDWDVSKVTNMERMFEGCESFNQDIGDWDVSKVTNMERMFEGCESFNQDIGDWDVSNVTDMSSMFSGAEKLDFDLSKWDTSNVKSMSFMFDGAKSFKEIDLSNRVAVNTDGSLLFGYKEGKISPNKIKFVGFRNFAPKFKYNYMVENITDGTKEIAESDKYTILETNKAYLLLRENTDKRVNFDINQSNTKVVIKKDGQIVEEKQLDGKICDFTFDFSNYGDKYTYEVTKDECEPINGEFELTKWGEQTINVVIGKTIETRTVNFSLTPTIAKLVVKDENGKIQTQTNGKYILPLGKYEYTCSLDGYVTKIENFDVINGNGEQTVNISLDKITDKKVDFHFYMKADDPNVNLNGFNIVIRNDKNEQVIKDDINANDYKFDYTVKLLAGNYTYEISKDDIESTIGSFVVKESNNQTEIVYVKVNSTTINTKDLTFNVNPSDVKITVYDKVGNIQIPKDGKYKLATGKYSYVAMKKGYSTFQDHFEIKDTDTQKLITVTLKKSKKAINLADITRTYNLAKIPNKTVKEEIKLLDLMPADVKDFSYELGEIVSTDNVKNHIAISETSNSFKYKLWDINDGFVTIPVKISSSNYADAYFKVRIELTNKIIPNVKIENINKVYDGKQLEDSDIKFVASVEKVTNTSPSATIVTTMAGTCVFIDKPSSVDVGEHNARVEFIPEDKIYAPIIKMMKVFITKATPNGEIKLVNKVSTTLSDAKLDATGMSVNGTVKWDLPLNTKVESGKKYSYTFVPENKNYKEVKGEFECYIAPNPNNNSSNNSSTGKKSHKSGTSGGSGGSTSDDRLGTSNSNKALDGNTKKTSEEVKKAVANVSKNPTKKEKKAVESAINKALKNASKNINTSKNALAVTKELNKMTVKAISVLDTNEAMKITKTQAELVKKALTNDKLSTKEKREMANSFINTVAKTSIKANAKNKEQIAQAKNEAKAVAKKVVKEAGTVKINSSLKDIKVGANQITSAITNAKTMASTMNKTLKENNIVNTANVLKPEITISADGKNKDTNIKIDEGAIKEIAKANVDVSVNTLNADFELDSNTIKKSSLVIVESKEVKAAEKVEYTNATTNGTAKQLKTLDMSVSLDGGDTSAKGVKISLPLNNIKDIDSLMIGVYENGAWTKVPYEIVGDKIVFTAPHFSVYSLMYYEPSFEDIGDSWAKKYITNLSAKGIVSGKSKRAFDPNGIITRAEFTQILVNVLGLDKDIKSNYSDVESDKWYYKAINQAKAYDIVAGATADNYYPNKAITREDMATMMAKAYELKYENSLKVENIMFNDSSEISPYAINAVNSMKSVGVISGYEDNTFRPKNSATRAEAVTMIYRLIK